MPQKFRSSFKILSYHSKPNHLFLKNFYNFCKKSRILSINPVLKHFQKKHTILRSPHVHKKARDQIEIRHHILTFHLKNNFNWLFFFCMFRKKSQYEFKIDYKHHYLQTVFFAKNISNSTEFK